MSGHDEGLHSLSAFLLLPHYSLFLDQISDFLTDLVLNTDKVIIVGDLSNYVDTWISILNEAFNNVLGSTNFD